jgi:hypothetical protein
MLYTQSETNFVAVKQPNESKDSKLGELTKDYESVWQGFEVTKRWVPRARKTFDIWRNRNPKQLPTLQISITLNSVKIQRCTAQWTSLNIKTGIAQSEALALAQVDNRPPKLVTLLPSELDVELWSTCSRFISRSRHLGNVTGTGNVASCEAWKLV